MKLSTRRHIALLVGLIAGPGCAWLSHDVPTDPDITFSAHAASRGLVIDKMEGGQLGVLEPSSTPYSGPQFVLRSGDTTTAALWISGPGIIVRPADPTAAAIGRVDASWDERAIRLTLKAESDGTFSTSVFKRTAGGAGPAALGQAADSLLDLRGTYRADVVDSSGAPAGWLRVRFAHSWGPHRVYEGALPAALNGPLAVAAVARLDAELTAVSNTAINPYIGN
jgi:hypothetical protein